MKAQPVTWRTPSGTRVETGTGPGEILANGELAALVKYDDTGEVERLDHDTLTIEEKV